MAESFLFNIAELLVKKLASAAYEEASRVIGVYDDLQEFKETLSYVKAVLLDAEQKQEHNHELREWMKQIRRVFSDAENVLDEVECEALRKQVVKTYGSTKTKVGRFLSCSNPLVFRYKLAKKIKELRQTLDRVAADRNKFGLVRIDVDRRVVHKREMTYSHVVDSDVIGREHDKKQIIQLLMQHDPSDVDHKSMSVIPIIGIGGMGKTTLAKFVFNTEEITEFFQLKMWVCVSDEFDIRQLIIKIIHCTDEFASDTRVGQQNLKELDTEQLQIHLRGKLAGQKFLLVLDDVWNDDRVKWIELRNLIQVGAQGSKILVTTRSPGIASMMGTVPAHNLEGLSLEDSLSLFVKWAFKEGEEEKYPKLVMIGEDIVKKCKGVPLALRTLGSLLFGKLGTDEWEFVRDNEIWNLSQKKEDILPALKLSYDQMPSYLKQCFSLFSLFPKDFPLTSFEVTPLLGAAGLLPLSNKSQTLQDVANQYLYELMSRSFLQDFVDLDTYYYFTIHDLVHDLALYVTKDECLMVNSAIQNIPENVQHLSFVDTKILGVSCTPKLAGVKTIMFPIKGIGANNEELLNTWVSMYKSLRVLDLSDSTYEILPKSIGKLKQLRYLDLNNNKKIKRLPDSICQLQHLQYFNLNQCTELETLPKGLEKLISLRHFEITTKQHVLPEREIANLSSLQILAVSCCNNIKSLFVGEKLSTIKAMKVEGCSRLKILPLDIEHFPQLETLQIYRCGSLELLEGYDDKSIHLRLRFFGIDSLPQLVTLPHWVEASAITLQSLEIAKCEQLEVFPEWFSTLIFLKSIWIANCPKLVSLPGEIHRLTALQFLRIETCSELCKKCQPHVGEYWPKISHIKKLIIIEPEQ